jgi:putative hydrolase of the HAD superfamily
VRAVLLDALGTLLRLQAPWPALAAGLREDHGIEVTVGQAEQAARAEMSYYRAHHAEGSDPESLAALRLRCAQVLRDSLPAAAAITPERLLPTLLAALCFEPFADVAPALATLRENGLRLVVVSNWDCSLAEVLERVSLRPLLDGVVTSAQVGAAKPDPAIFAQALTMAGVRAPEALHAGDTIEDDVEGARAAGVAPVLVRRDGGREGPAGVPVIASLSELLSLAA